VVKLTRLRHLREQAAYSQTELAKKAGVSRATLNLIEACTREPQPRTIRRLAEALGVKPPELWETPES
jgi:transcriptional regulator with XRE-family HTH domain